MDIMGIVLVLMVLKHLDGSHTQQSQFCLHSGMDADNSTLLEQSSPVECSSLNLMVADVMLGETDGKSI